MISFAVLGTSAIVRQFVDAAIAQGWTLSAVIGSRHDSAAAFIARLGDAAADATAFGDVESAVAASCRWDVVYIASPNSLHYDHVIAMIDAGTQVIVEKPAFSNRGEWMRAHEHAQRRGVLLIEAARHLFEPNYLALRDEVRRLDAVAGASLVFRQFSSRYPAYLAGQRPRVFTAEYSGGALADLGVYTLYAAIDWFGVPESATYAAHVLPDTGADAEGVAQLAYPGYLVNLSLSKAQASRQRNEVYGPDGSIVSFNSVAAVDVVEVWTRGAASPRSLALAPVPDNPLAPEVAAFTDIIEQYAATAHESTTYERLRALGEQVITVSGWMRASAGVVFPADARSPG